MRKRISSNQKMTMVLRILRGETLDEVSRTEGVLIADLNIWHERFLNAGIHGLKNSPREAKEAEYERVIGKLQMEIELLKKRPFSKTKRVCRKYDR